VDIFHIAENVHEFQRKCSYIKRAMKTSAQKPVVLTVLIASASSTLLAQANNEAFFRKYFGVNISIPVGVRQQTSGFPSAEKYSQHVHNIGYEESPFRLTSQCGQFTAVDRLWSNTTKWTDLFPIVDELPNNTSIRVGAAVHEYYEKPNGIAQMYDHVEALIKGIAFRGNKTYENAHNIMWSVIPSLQQWNATSDVWNLTPVSCSTQPKFRNFFRPENAALPYIKTNITKFIEQVNFEMGKAGGCVGGTSGNPIYNNTKPFTEKTQIQLGNEPGIGHPGGSSFGPAGSWEDLGRVMGGTMYGQPFGSNFNNGSPLPKNLLTMPAFSFLYEGNPDQDWQNGDQTMNWWNKATPFTPGVNEFLTYASEVNYSPAPWATSVNRRAAHYRAPRMLCVLVDTNNNPILANGKRQLFFERSDSAGVPRRLRWETATEYADRWYEGLVRLIRGIQSMNMNGVGTTVDITECYLANGATGAEKLGSKVDLTKRPSATMPPSPWNHLQGVRWYARLNNLPCSAIPVVAPTRRDVILAIRQKLLNVEATNGNGYLRDTLGLGKIYWWGVYNFHPRQETGLEPGSGFNGDLNAQVTGYDGDIDFMLNLAEIKALMKGI
jgi:hypothetical protein